MKQLSKLQKWGLIGLSALVITVTSILIISYKNLGLKSRKQVIQTTEREVENELKALEKKLQEDFQNAQKVVHECARVFSKQPYKAQELALGMPALSEFFTFSGISVNPSEEYSLELLQYDSIYKVKTEKELWSAFYKSGSKKTVPFEYDYTDTKTQGRFWYSRDILEGRWTEPYMGAAVNNLVVSYTAPLLWKKGQKQNDGVVCLDYALDYIQNEVAKLKLFRKGYGIIINENSMVISHPSSTNLAKNINEVIPEDQYAKIKSLPENKFLAIEEYSDRLVDRNLFFKRKLRIISGDNPITYEAIIILKESETLSAFNEGINPTEEVKSLRLEILCGITLLFSLGIFWLYVLLNQKRVWLLIALQSTTYIIGTLLIIFVQLKTPLYSFSSADVEITNPTELAAYQNAIDREGTLQDPITIETGVLIQNVKFSSANELLITGMIWQKPTRSIDHLLDSDDSSIAEILKPDFPEAESLDMQLLSEEKGLVRWEFFAEVRQSFDYSNYPFDEEDIWLRLRPKENVQDQILFVPDFDSYYAFASQNDHYLNPNLPDNMLKNGLETGLFIKGWDIERTSFSMRDREYATSFGKFNLTENYSYPELYFSINVKRRFLEVFVVYFIPILVTAFLLFTILMTYTLDSKINELYGFNVSTVLGFCASLFFVIIVSHMSVRETLQTGGIIYLEYFFFCLYFLMTLVSIGAFFFSSSSAPKFLQKGNGDLVKKLYWPSFCFIIFVLTAFHFTVL